MLKRIWLIIREAVCSPMTTSVFETDGTVKRYYKGRLVKIIK